MYSGERLATSAENSSNFSEMGYLRPSSPASATKRPSMSLSRELQSTWYWMCAFTSSSRSVSLLSVGKRLPEADTTTNLRSGSDLTMSLTLRNCPASATDEPPNFATLIILG